MKYCNKCRILHFDNSAFCTNCGSPLKQSPSRQNPKMPSQQGIENKTSKTLHTFGILILVFGIIGSFIMGGVFPSIDYSYYYGSYHTYETYNWALAIASSIICFISGICFIGFSEIIRLLQENIYQQNTMLQYLKKQTASKENSQQE